MGLLPNQRIRICKSLLTMGVLEIEDGCFPPINAGTVKRLAIIALGKTRGESCRFPAESGPGLAALHPSKKRNQQKARSNERRSRISGKAEHKFVGDPAQPRRLAGPDRDFRK